MIKKIYPVLFITLVNVLSFALFLPVLPFIIEKFTDNPSLQNIRYALLMAVYPFFQFFASPFRWWMSDKYWRKKILIISLWWTFVSLIFFYLAFFTPNIELLWVSFPLLMIFFARALDWITWWNMWVISASLIDIVEPKQRTKAFWLFWAMIAIWLSVWPMLWWFISDIFWYNATIFTTLVIVFFSRIWLVFWFKETLHNNREKKIKFWDELNIYKQFNENIKKWRLKSLFLIQSVFYFVFACYITLNIKYMQVDLGLGWSQIWLIYLFIWIVLFISQTFFVHKLTNFFWEKKIYLTWLLVVVLTFVVLWVFHLWLFTFCILLWLLNFGISIVINVFRSLVSNMVDNKIQWKIIWLSESIDALSLVVWPLFVMFFYNIIWYRIFLILWIVLFIWTLFYIFMKKNTKQLW